MNKDLIEDKLNQIIDQCSERKITCIILLKKYIYFVMEMEDHLRHCLLMIKWWTLLMRQKILKWWKVKKSNEMIKLIVYESLFH